MGQGRARARRAQVVAYTFRISGAFLRRICSAEAKRLAVAFVAALLRAQALHAISRQLAAGTDALRPLQQPPEGGLDDSSDGALQDHVAQTLLVSVEVTYQLVYMLIDAKPLVGLGAGKWAEQCLELLTAIRDSCILEHAARVEERMTERIFPSSGGGGAPAGAFSDYTRKKLLSLLQFRPFMVSFLCGTLAVLEVPSLPEPPGLGAAAAAAAAQLRGVLCGPGRCVLSMGLFVGVASLCAADGGPAYGLPPGIISATRASVDRRVADAPQGPQLACENLQALLRMLGLPGRPTPPGRCGALALALRVARLSVASAVHAAVPAAAEEEEEEKEEEAHRLRGEGLPPDAPPPLLAAALCGGVVPCLERLLRRAGRAPDGLEAAIVRSWCGKRADGLLAALLAYGEPRQAAALVATLGKLVRALEDPRVVTAAWDPELDTQQCLLAAASGTTACSVQHIVAAQRAAGPGPAAAAGGPAGPAAAQLPRVLSLALCACLPPLASLLRRVAKQLRLQQRSKPQAPAGAADMAPFSECRQFEALLAELLPALPLLARQCVASCGGAEVGSTAAVGKDAEAAAEPAAAAAWRSLLLDEAGAVQLLGAVLELAAARAGVPETPPLPPSAEQQQQQQEPPQAAPQGERSTALASLVTSCCAVVDVLATEQQQKQQQRHGGAKSGAAEAAAEAAAAAAVAVTVVGGDGAQGSGPDGNEPPQLVAWRPEHLRAVAGLLRSSGQVQEAADAEELAAQLQAGCGRRRAGDARPRVGSGAPSRHAGGEAVAADGGGERAPGGLLLPLATARSLLPGCANPACVNLEGDSEAELLGQRELHGGEGGCGGEGVAAAVLYCSAECRVACKLRARMGP
ncbi:hypothetical protein GPECTOR_49g529 [Gonium pectorale]|uniref:MYND-type domain-containing protein n=1 Tax=Gonium pectorale TaxID=33097 RepID=A0A150G8Q9_GONPE|nr:hypothetical protein GPECTOR_49g529 [Gonium pectorale]|eukprot:KXZ45945.1 hypothetical protein GPECTOR_49g529 [Gonium pectorale]